MTETNQKLPWRKRQSVRALKESSVEYRDSLDQGDFGGRTSEIPDGDRVSLDAISLVEAFTPSTISSLYAGLEDLAEDAESASKNRRNIETVRGSNRATWMYLGIIARRTYGGFPYYRADPTLPPGVDAVTLSIDTPVPSLSLVVATFILESDASDMSDILHSSFDTRFRNPRLNVRGPFSSIRTHIPWSRPSKYSLSREIVRPDLQKREACENFMRLHEEECAVWLDARFPGRFSRERISDRPSARVVASDQSDPHAKATRWTRYIGSNDFSSWTSSSAKKWKITGDSGNTNLTFTIQRPPADDGSTNQQTAWELAQHFAQRHDSLMSRWAIAILMERYLTRIGKLRDAGVNRHKRRTTLALSRELDSYLVEDGLDLSVVAPDVLELTKDPFLNGPDVARFHETRGTKNTGRDLIEEIRTGATYSANRLLRESRSVMDSASASAALRQSISNTRLQRWTTALAILALVVAIAGLAVAWLTLKNG